MKEVDWTRMFTPGKCPENIQGMKNLIPDELSGEWYMQRTSKFMMEGMTPSCHHAVMDIDENGKFTANEEASFMGKKFVAEDMTGEFTDNVVRADFFNDKMSVKVMVMDTDYDNYMIGYECFDNIQFTLEDDNIEPVHILKVAILTRKPDEDEAFNE